MRERGMLVKKGTLGGDGDLEFWEDGGVESRKERKLKESMAKEEKRQEGGKGPE